MKKRPVRQFVIILMIILFSFTLCGCAVTDLAGEVIETMRSDRDKEDTKEKRTSRRKKNDGDDEDEEDQDDNEADDGADSGDEDADEKNGSADDEVSYHADGELTGRELSELATLFSGPVYYGFLLTEYQDPKDIDWNEVFYNGAGLSFDGSYEEAVKEYQKQTGEEELLGDLTVISEENLQTFVRSTTGYDYKEMRHPLNWWTYLPECKAYAFEHGDTNYRSEILAVNGSVRDNVYTVQYNYNGGFYEGPPSFTVTFTRNGQTLRFLSNRANEYDEASAAYEEDPADTDVQPDYIISDSDSRKLTDYDLSGLNAWELRIARNEIYARHGRMFKDKELQDYFDGQSWYYGTISPSQWSEKNLNQYEAYNVNLISKYEKNAPAGEAPASNGYSNNELCQMALNYYSKHYGYRPGIAEVDSVNGNMVTIHLYDDMGTHTATSAWYEIDRNTGKGTDEIMGGKVDLNR
ncbi:MAG: YARHG domain-containing protein [Lachnospiraceae bacterium]|nr:YARHG domain-containing protein [Lachnospiraceae bacterium]